MSWKRNCKRKKAPDSRSWGSMLPDVDWSPRARDEHDGDERTYRLPTKALRLFRILAILGGVTLAAGLFLAPQRTWIDVLLVSNYLVGLGLSGLLLVALHYVTGARWSLPLRRVPEAMTAVLPVAAIGLGCRVALPAFAVSLVGAGFSHGSESPLQHLWLNRPFFLLRSLVYLALWLAFAVAVVRNSRRQDSDRDRGADREEHPPVGAFLGGLWRHVLAGQLRLDHVSGTGVGQYDIWGLQLCRSVSERSGCDHSLGHLVTATQLLADCPQRGSLARSRYAPFRLQQLLDVYLVLPVPADLVRKQPRGDGVLRQRWQGDLAGAHVP